MRRFGSSFYPFSSNNRPLAPGGNTSNQNLAQNERRRYASVTRDTSVEPRARSPLLSPRTDSLLASPKYSDEKATTSPISSPKYRAPTARAINSPTKTVDEYPKYKSTTQQPRSPEAERKSIVYKALEKVTKSSDHHFDSGKMASSLSSHKHQPNAINITGENIGAVMEIVDSPKQGHTIKKKLETDHQINNEASKDHKADAQKAPNSLPASTFLNSNFQSVNNSLLYNANFAHRDPGLHLAFSRKPTVNRVDFDDKKHQQHQKY